MENQSCEIQNELQKKFLVIQEGKCICMKGKERKSIRSKKNSYSFTKEIRDVVLDFNN
jgi:hypothetical protein